MPMPEFAMPPHPPPAGPSPAGSSPAGGGRPPAREEPEPDAALLRADRGPRWRQLAAAGLVGVLVGAAMPALLHAVDRAAADARAEALRGTTMAYLTAIADGDAAIADAMVPPSDAGDPPDAELTAQRIRDPEVWLTSIEGDVATAEVRFDVGSRRVARTLDAAWTGGAWALRTSLAEPVTVHSSEAVALGVGVTVGGATLRADAPTLLYPGRYEIDDTDAGLLRIGGEPFEVDGDPGTPTAAFARATPGQALADAASAVARARVGPCQLLAECPIDARTARSSDALEVVRVDPANGVIDLAAPLGLGLGYGARGHVLQLRAIVDEAGALTGWQCSDPGAPQRPLEPCGP